MTGNTATLGAATVRIVGRYALYQAIASGGMATVFLGRLLGPVGFSRTVAIKRLHAQFASDPKFVSMFLDEAKLAARIRHPNVVPTLDVVATQGELFLVLEYVHGESLGRLMRTAAEQEAPIPVPIVVAILSGALQGLDAAHEAKTERGVPLKLVHRDISPQNILIGRDGQARILDFGVARASVRLHTTQAGEVKGKIAYMPPEQLHGEEVGPATDVYAAAVVLWEALTGRRLFRASGDGALVVEVLEAKVEPPSHSLAADGDDARARLAEPLDAIVMRGLERSKDKRWQTARDFARALEAAVAPATVAQVSDWIEKVAGIALGERAAMVAEIESSNPVHSTSGDLGTAIAAASEARLRSDWPPRNPVTTPLSERPPSSVLPASGTGVRRSNLPSYAPSAGEEATIRDVEGPSVPGATPARISTSDAAAGTKRSNAPFAGRLGPTLPSVGTSGAQETGPRMLTAARDPSAFAETLQSVMSPMSEIDSAPVAKRADALTAAAAAEGTSPKASRGWMVPLVLGALVVALIPVLVVLAYTRHAATRTVVEQEGAPPPAPSAPNVQPR